MTLQLLSRYILVYKSKIDDYTTVFFRNVLHIYILLVYPKNFEHLFNFSASLANQTSSTKPIMGSG
jgi:hypothetical protein